MKVSIIVPIYNVEKYLAQCLNSLLSQSYEDYEIVAVDDGSTDSSYDVLERYASENKKIKVVRQENKGLGGARNAGIREAEGEYILLVDSDDYIDSTSLSVLVETLEMNDLDLLVFRVKRVDLDGTSLEPEISESGAYRSITKKQFMLTDCTGCNKVYRRCLFTEHDIWFPEQMWYEDLATVYKLALHAKKIGTLDRQLYFYLQRPQSITHSKKSVRMFEILTAFESEEDYFKSLGCYEEYYYELEWLCVLHVLYFSAFRLLGEKADFRALNRLYVYVKKRFPSFKTNCYVQQNIKKLDMLEWVIQRRFLLFWLHSGFLAKIYRIYCFFIKRKSQCL